MAEPLEKVSVVALDSNGNGVTPNGAIVPLALPGERARVSLEGKRGELVETLELRLSARRPSAAGFAGAAAAQRSTCRLALSRMERGLVIEALKREGVSAKVEELVDAHGASRRARLSTRLSHGQPDEVGFMRARSHDIIAIDDCPLFSPGMAGAIQAARALSGDLRGLMKPLDIKSPPRSTGSTSTCAAQDRLDAPRRRS